MRVLLIGLILFGCKTSPASVEPVPPVSRPGDFRYDAATGTCRDSQGNTGFNARTLVELIANRDGECVSFELSKIQHLNDLGNFVDFERWNLRGADLGRTGLTYSRLLDADLEGAQLSEILTFYYCLKGRVDGHTSLPSGVTATQGTVSAGDSCP